MLKIGDFSKLSRISIRMLRHYDETGLLIPASVDHFTGYRYYSEEQLLTGQRIQMLRNMDFGLADIAQILLKYDDPERMEQFLLSKQKELEQEAMVTQQRLKLLANTIGWMRKDGKIMDYNVTLKTLPERYVASLRRVIPAYNCEGMLWEQMNGEIADQNVQMETPCYGLAIFHDEGFKEKEVDVEIQCCVNGTYKDTEHVKFKTVPSVLIASVTYKGSYDQITRVNSAVADWIRDNGYMFNGSSFCIYHVSPHDAKTEDDLVTEVCFPVRKA